MTGTREEHIEGKKRERRRERKKEQEEGKESKSKAGVSGLSPVRCLVRGAKRGMSPLQHLLLT